MMRKRRMAALLGALFLGGALAAVLSTGLAGAAHASDPIVPSATWNEVVLPFDNGRGNTMCVDVPGGTAATGAQLQFFHCHGYASDGAPQRWRFFCAGGLGCSFGGQNYQLSNTHSLQCIGFPNGDVFGTAGERLVQESCSNTLGWTVVQGAGSGPFFELRGLGSDNLCMAAANTSDNNQTPLVALPCDGEFQDGAQLLELG